MKFGQYLHEQLYSPWKENYIDYDTLKYFLKYKQEQPQGWTHIDEAYFANTLLIAELSKIHTFFELQLGKIREAESRRNLISYIKLNATGFQKILKKHDKWTGINLSSSVHFCDISNQFESLVKKINDITLDDQRKMTQYWIHPEDIVKVQTILLFHLRASVQQQLTNTVYFDDQNNFPCYLQQIKRINNGHALSAKWVGALMPETTVTLWHEIYDYPWTYKNEMPFRQSECLQYNQLILGIEEKKEKMLTQDICEYIQTENMRPTLKYSRMCTEYNQSQKSLRVVLNEDILLTEECELTRVSLTKDSVKQFNFPYALLEVEIDTAVVNLPDWLIQLIENQLVYEVPFFSIYLHGISHFYKERVLLLPWWLEDLKSDFRKKLYYNQIPLAASNYAPLSNLESRQSNFHIVVNSSPHHNQLNSINMDPQAFGEDKTFVDQHKHNSFFQRAAINYESKFMLSDKLMTNLKSMKHDLDLYRQELNTQYSDNMSMTVWLRAKLTNNKSILFPEHLTVEKPKKKKVEPKMFFSNERTFINWLQFSALLLTVSLGLINFGDRVSKASGAFFIIISMILAFYAQLRFQYRSWQIQYRSSSRFDDIYGPAVLCFVLIIALFVNLGLRINQPIPSNPSPFSYNVTSSNNITIPHHSSNPEQPATKTDRHIADKHSTTRIPDASISTKSATPIKKKNKEEDEDEDED
ncbi:VTC domain-containing protein [Choanephora cucurbitarum]|nr:VTC domain-containing protein [Choanephora cucurbitarum]